jgi:hypothetical protein
MPLSTVTTLEAFRASLDPKDLIIHDLAARMLKTRYDPLASNAYRAWVSKAVTVTVSKAVSESVSKAVTVTVSKAVSESVSKASKKEVKAVQVPATPSTT